MSSCKLADRIAALSINTYRALCPAELQQSYQQTVLASIVLQITTDSSEESALRLVALGVGTKVLSMHRILEGRELVDNLASGDTSVRDMHAEVLAKRGFVRFLLEELKALKLGNRQDSVLDLDPRGFGYKMKDSVSVHLYSSSQPCGNATIKRWAKAKRAAEFPELPAHCLPASLLHHTNFFPKAIDEGEIAALVKTNNAVASSASICSSSSSSRHVPPGMALSSSGAGNVMSCSDKLAAWNALGLQGALPSLLLPRPIYLRSITVGRKFSEAHCRRALCCRIAGFRYPLDLGIGDNGFCTQHPAMLATRLKLDEGSLLCAPAPAPVTVTVTARDAPAVAMSVGAQFSQSRCFVAWLCAAASPHYAAEVLDGSTGLLRDGAASSISTRAQVLQVRLLLHAEDMSLRALKQAAVAYRAAKQRLRAAPFCMADWVRKPGGSEAGSANAASRSDGPPEHVAVTELEGGPHEP